MYLSWMAWTPQTAIFFIVIALFLIGMSVWEIKSPGGAPRKGIFRIETTRGDRLFISLLSAAYLHLTWLVLFEEFPLYWATVCSGLLAVFIFRKV